MYFFYSNGDKKDEVYLNLILEYVPETVYKGYINGLIRYINVTIVYKFITYLFYPNSMTRNIWFENKHA